MKLLTWSMETLRRTLRGRALFIIPAAAACIMALPSIFTGICFDDYFARAVLVQGDRLPEFLRRSPCDEFSFTKRNDREAARAAVRQGIYPWWTSRDYAISFCRPFASLLHWVDYTLLHKAYWAMHLHSILWYGLLALAAALAYRRFVPEGWIAGLAALLYVLDSRHGLPVAYLNNRYALMTAFFSILCLISYDRWRRDQHLISGGGACLFYCTGLLAGESTVSVCAFLFSYAVFMEKGPVVKRLAPLAPFAAITVVWRMLYVAFSFSTGGTAFYNDPLHDAAAFLAAFPLRIATLLLSQFTVPHAALVNVLPPRLTVVYGAIAIAVLLTMLHAIKPLLKQDAVRFFGLGTVLSLVPLCATVPDDRMLTLPGFGAMGVIASFLAAVCSRPAAPRCTTRLRRVLAGALLAISFLVGPVLFQVNAWTMRLLQKPLDTMADAVGDRLPPGATAVIVNAPMDIAVSYIPFILMERDAAQMPHMLLLSAGRSAVRVTRTGAQTLRLRLRRGMLETVFERIFRGDYNTLQTGDMFRLPCATVTVDSLTPDRRVAGITYEFHTPLDAKRLVWFCYTHDGLKPFVPPARGAELIIPAPPHFLKLVFTAGRQPAQANPWHRKPPWAIL